MTIQTIVNELGLEVFAGKDKQDSLVSGAYASDLLSDVMGNARKGDIWITMQTHGNIIAVASLKELAAIIVVNGGHPDEIICAKADSEGIVLLGTGHRSFDICGRLYKMLKNDAMVQR